jgi:serine/threonine-protein kinase
VVGTDPGAGNQISAGHHLYIEVSTGPSAVSIPKVAGDTPGKAVGILEKAGFKATTHGEHSSTVASGRVIGTDPSEGSKEPKGSAVKVLVSSGHKPVSIPSVADQTPVNATLTLSNAGFVVKEGQSQASNSVPAGDVIGTTPGMGQVEPYGSTVYLLVSTGPSTVTVPNLAGDRQSYAAGVLSRHHLTPHWSYQTTTDKAQNGRVINTNPPAFTTVNRGSTVTVFIGQYSAPTTTSTSTSTTTTTTTSSTTTTTTTPGPNGKPKRQPPPG